MMVVRESPRGWQRSGLKGRTEALEETIDSVRGRDEVRLLNTEGCPPSEVVGVEGTEPVPAMVSRLKDDLA
jgi:hypothetical protein